MDLAARLRHSRNLAERPELALVIYDSTVFPAERQALYRGGGQAARQEPRTWPSPATQSILSPRTSSR